MTHPTGNDPAHTTKLNIPSIKKESSTCHHLLPNPFCTPNLESPSNQFLSNSKVGEENRRLAIRSKSSPKVQLRLNAISCRRGLVQHRTCLADNEKLSEGSSQIVRSVKKLDRDGIITGTELKKYLPSQQRNPRRTR